MGKLTFLGLEHLPIGFAGGTYDKGFGLAYAAVPFRFYTFTAYRDKYWYTEAGKIISDSSGNSSGFAWLNLPVSYVAAPEAKRLIMGFRVKNATGYNVTWDDKTLAMTNLGSGQAAGTTVLATLFNPKEINMPLRVEFYIELEIDFATGVVKRWSNGKPIAALTLTGAALAAVQSKAFEFSFQANQTLCTPAINDVYFREVLEEDKLVARLGAVVVKRAALDTVDGAGWTAGKGPALKDDLATVMNSNAAVSAPVIAAPEPPTPLQVKFANGKLVDTDRILALAVSTALVKSDNNAASVKASATLDKLSSDFGTAAVGNPFSLQYPFQPLLQAPGNHSWTAARLKQTQFTLLLQRG